MIPKKTLHLRLVSGKGSLVNNSVKEKSQRKSGSIKKEIFLFANVVYVM